MVHQIQSNLYERQGAAITNFSETLPSPQSDLAHETLKSPYVFDFLAMGEKIQERDLENALISNIKRFLLELGKGFAYVGNQYNLNIEGDDYFLDLLFYNTRLHCYVVFELKIGDFKPEYVGKLNFYINTVDEQIKTAHDLLTVGVLLCKTPNKTVVEYALRGLDKPLGVADYELSKALPEKLKANLPTEEELVQEMEKEIELPISPLDEKIKSLKQKISSLGMEQVKEERNSNTTRKIADMVLYPIHDHFTKRNREVAALFKKEEVSFATSSVGYADTDIQQFEKELAKDPFPLCLRISYNFRGFIGAGTNAFDVWVDMRINLDEFKYSLAIGRKENIVMKRLYDHLLDQEEINQFTEVMMEKLMGEIDENLNSIQKRIK